MHGLELQIEAVRQLRGQSTNQVPGARVGMVISGPMVTPVSSMLARHGDVLVSAPAYYLPAGLPRPVAEPDGLDTPYWEGTRARELRDAALPSVPRLAVGPRVDLSRLPGLRPGVGGGRAARHDLFLGARVASRASRAARARAVRGGRWSSCRTRATCAWSATFSAIRSRRCRSARRSRPCSRPTTTRRRRSRWCTGE